MKFTILITCPLSSPTSASALRFCRSLEQSGHTLLGVFLAGEGVEIAQTQLDDAPISHINAPVYACISSCQKLGLATSTGKATTQLSPEASLSSLTQLAMLEHASDKNVTFGDKYEGVHDAPEGNTA